MTSQLEIPKRYEYSPTPRTPPYHVDDQRRDERRERQPAAGEQVLERGARAAAAADREQGDGVDGEGADDNRIHDPGV